MENTNTTNFLRDESNDNIKLMLEQDIATTARQACDLRHPNIILSATDMVDERMFEAYFTERLSEDDHAELVSQLQYNFGEDNIMFIEAGLVKNCHVYKVTLHVAK